MFKSLVSAAAVFSLLFPTLISPAAAYARRCPDEPSSTLLSLYRSSDAIYLGKFDKTTEGEIVAKEEGYTSVSVSDHFTISSTLKGKNRKFFVRTYEQYRYEGQTETETTEGEAAEETPEEEYDGSYQPVKPGDTVLLFLKFSDEDEEGNKKKKTLDVAHYRDAIKRMNAQDVASYQARIKDLNKIFSSKKPDDAAILNWLIRCIEDPATRWEGAFELQQAFETLEWKEQQEKEKAEQKETAEEGESAETEEPVVDEEEHEVVEEELDNSVYARLLTPQQKDRLAEIAISAAPVQTEGDESSDISEGEEQGDVKPEVEKPPVDISEGDRVLLNLVKRWGDSRLARVMLDRLSVSADNWDKAQWMSSIAEVLKDKELSEISEKFGEVTYQEDEAVVEDKKESETAKPDAETGGEKDQPAETKPVAYEMPGELDDAPAKKTYKQLRDELLAGFINRANVVLASETMDDEAK